MKIDITLEELRALRPDLGPWAMCQGVYVEQLAVYMNWLDRSNIQIAQFRSWDSAIALKRNLFDQLLPYWRIMKAAGH